MLDGTGHIRGSDLGGLSLGTVVMFVAPPLPFPIAAADEASAGAALLPLRPLAPDPDDGGCRLGVTLLLFPLICRSRWDGCRSGVGRFGSGLPAMASLGRDAAVSSRAPWWALGAEDQSSWKEGSRLRGAKNGRKPQQQGLRFLQASPGDDDAHDKVIT